MSLTSILEKLSEPFPKEEVKSRFGFMDQYGKRHDMAYVDWISVVRRLNTISPNWVSDIRNIEYLREGEKIIGCSVTCRITIDNIFHEGVGASFISYSAKTDTWENFSETHLKGAESDALKRAASKFGIALELYGKEGQTIAQQTQASFNAKVNKDQQQSQYKSNNNGNVNRPPQAPTATNAQQAQSPKQMQAYSKWEDVPIHFGRYNGDTLGTINQVNAQYMDWLIAEWLPKPARNDNDRLVKDWLEVANSLLGGEVQ